MPKLSYPDPPLSLGAVLLRPWTADDIPFVVEACQDPSLARYSPAIPFPYTDADAFDWFNSQEPARLAGVSIDLAVTEADSARRLGAIGLHDVDTIRRSAGIGYWLAPSARGHGYITLATGALARWAFDRLGLARLELTTDPENLASQRVAERSGFRLEGRLRSHMLIRHSGERRDSLVYSLLPGELTVRADP